MKHLALFLLFGLAGAASAQTPPLPPPPAEDPISAKLISRKDALQLAVTAVDSCASRGEHAAAQIFDAKGYLRAAVSDDGTPPRGLTTSLGKAHAVLDFRASSAELTERLKTDKEFAAKVDKNERYFFHDGALPIYRQGEFVAVIAVGGAHNIDEACARDALKTLDWARSEK